MNLFKRIVFLLYLNFTKRNCSKNTLFDLVGTEVSTCFFILMSQPRGVRNQRRKKENNQMKESSGNDMNTPLWTGQAEVWCFYVMIWSNPTTSIGSSFQVSANNRCETRPSVAQLLLLCFYSLIDCREEIVLDTPVSKVMFSFMKPQH